MEIKLTQEDDRIIQSRVAQSCNHKINGDAEFAYLSVTQIIVGEREGYIYDLNMKKYGETK
tara:strand:- start:29 stop:211 length:183 start_codon:yes stop_codon:yes gene_type:complete